MEPAAVPELAFRKGFHRMVAYDMSRACRAMLDACPTCEFEGLEAGKSYCYKPSCGSPALVVVEQTTAKRRQAVARVNQGEPGRIYKGDYYSTFVELSAELCALTGITHEMVVAAAVAKGLDVPAEVRREYPALFVEIPERFAQPPNTTATERVTHALSASWVASTKTVTPATIDVQIEDAHRQIATTQDTRCQAVALNPDTAPDYDRYIQEYRNDIDFYRWLRKLVDVGGVFYLEETK